MSANWTSNAFFVGCLCILFFSPKDGAAHSFYMEWVHPVLIMVLAWKAIKYDVKGWREKGWRGLFVVQAVEFVWMALTAATYMTLYFAGTLLLRTLGAFHHRVLMTSEESKWAWVRGIREQPLNKRTEGFWEDSVSRYKWYVKWDHDEAEKAVDYYRNLTRRRREWALQIVPPCGAEGGGA